MRPKIPPFLLNRKQRFLLLTILPIYFIVAGLVTSPMDEIIRGLYHIIVEPDLLITDYIVIGGVGATFVNAGLLTLCTIFMLYKSSLDFDGHTITACCLIFGFSLFGKNILNIWTILMGVWVYAIYHNTSLSRFIYVGLYGTSLSPIITQILQIGNLSPVTKGILSIVVGLIIGFVLPPLSSHLYYSHHGYSLYNVGFSAGIISTVIASIFKSFDIEAQSRLIWSTGNNTFFGLLLGIFFIGLVLLGLVKNKEGFMHYKKILHYTGVGAPDYVVNEGLQSTFINMGINGLFATFAVIIVGGDLNGPTIGGIFTIVGFSATGKHIRNIFPIMLGVFIAGFLKNWSINEPGPIITLLFATTLAPIAGRFGFFVGILTGFIHSSVALNIGILYDGMNLYNNGFAGGIVACFLVPVIQSVVSRKDRVKKAL